MKTPKPTIIDKAVGYFAPARGLQRQRARVATALLEQMVETGGQPLRRRHFEAAAIGRRTQGWARASTDANAAASGDALARIRNVARDLARNNAHAKSAVKTIGDHVVGWGIEAKAEPASEAALTAWKSWADSTACDADGRNNFAGLQKLVVRTVAQDGECLVRLRPRLPEDGLPLPLQIQVLEIDYLDTAKSEMVGGRRIVQGVEFDPIGRRTAYWLFPEHPGSALPGVAGQQSKPVPAESVLHVYEQERAGQVRGYSWFAPVVLKLKDYDDYDDAQLMKQKVAACLAVITTDTDGSSSPLGVTTDEAGTIDELAPGLVINAPLGRDVKVVDPPSVDGYADYARITLQTIATGLGLAYEDLTGDYGEVSFSASRMSRLRHQDRVHDWRWQMLIPQFCEPVWGWVMAAAVIAGKVSGAVPRSAWTPPPLPFIEPDKEGLAIQRNIRSGIQTLSESLRERGYDPRAVLEEMRRDNALLDELGLLLDSDPRRMTQGGQAQSVPTAEPPPDPPTRRARR